MIAHIIHANYWNYETENNCAFQGSSIPSVDYINRNYSVSTHTQTHTHTNAHEVESSNQWRVKIICKWHCLAQPLQMDNFCMPKLLCYLKTWFAVNKTMIQISLFFNEINSFSTYWLVWLHSWILWKILDFEKAKSMQPRQKDGCSSPDWIMHSIWSFSFFYILWLISIRFSSSHSGKRKKCWCFYSS